MNLQNVAPVFLLALCCTPIAAQQRADPEVPNKETTDVLTDWADAARHAKTLEVNFRTTSYDESFKRVKHGNGRLFTMPDLLYVKLGPADTLPATPGYSVHSLEPCIYVFTPKSLVDISPERKEATIWKFRSDKETDELRLARHNLHETFQSLSRACLDPCFISMLGSDYGFRVSSINPIRLTRDTVPYVNSRAQIFELKFVIGNNWPSELKWTSPSGNKTVKLIFEEATTNRLPDDIEQLRSPNLSGYRIQRIE